MTDVKYIGKFVKLLCYLPDLLAFFLWLLSLKILLSFLGFSEVFALGLIDNGFCFYIRFFLCFSLLRLKFAISLIAQSSLLFILRTRNFLLSIINLYQRNTFHAFNICNTRKFFQLSVSLNLFKTIRKQSILILINVVHFI